MRFFDKENFDLLTTSPGNYIFKNKSNKSEFGKLTSILHILLSFIILIYNLYSYNKGSGMNVSYSKIAVDKNLDDFKKIGDKFYYILGFSNADPNDIEKIYISFFNKNTRQFSQRFLLDLKELSKK